MFDMEYCEGQFISTTENLIFEVKGIVHPKEKVIAYLRYIPDSKGIRRQKDNAGYRKIYDLYQRDQFLKRNFPQYLWKDPIHDRRLQAVPKEKIRKVMNPIEYLEKLRKQGEIHSMIHRITLELSEKLVKSSGIEWRRIGVTGSILADLLLPTSDIDLVVYGTEPVRQVYEAISTRRNEIGIEPYRGEKLHDHVVNRWGCQSAEKMRALIKIEQNKVLQGIYKGIDIYIRGVKLPSEINWKYGDLQFKRGSRDKVHGIIKDSTQSIYTPCEYVIKCNEKPAVRKIISFRGRFTEHAKIGEEVVVEGTIEQVRDRRRRLYEQIVLGEDPRDMLIPLRYIKEE